MFEYLFILSTAHTVITLPYISYFRKEYILDIDDKDAGLNIAQWFAMFMTIEVLCLKTLPILTKVAVMSFFLYEFKFEMTGSLDNQRASPRLTYKVNYKHGLLSLILRIIFTIGCVVYDYWAD